MAATGPARPLSREEQIQAIASRAPSEPTAEFAATYTPSLWAYIDARATEEAAAAQSRGAA